MSMLSTIWKIAGEPLIMLLLILGSIALGNWLHTLTNRTKG